jgi:hypothetical protein
MLSAGGKGACRLNTLSELILLAEGFAAIFLARCRRRIVRRDGLKADDLFEETLAAQIIQKAA